MRAAGPGMRVHVVALLSRSGSGRGGRRPAEPWVRDAGSLLEFVW